ADGWRVIGTVRSASAKLPPGIERHIADVTDARQVAALARALRGMALDVLFCNAGIVGKRGMALGSFDYESWQEVFRVNVLGAARTRNVGGRPAQGDRRTDARGERQILLARRLDHPVVKPLAAALTVIAVLPDGKEVELQATIRPPFQADDGQWISRVQLKPL